MPNGPLSGVDVGATHTHTCHRQAEPNHDDGPQSTNVWFG